MDFEERAKRRRRQMIKVLIAEVGMVVSIIAIVVVATLASMGFFVSRDGKIEQSGLIQIHSMPTGASVELDGATLFPRTNLSRSMPAGEHQLKLSRDGYDSWSKTVKMYSGRLIRLYYPRLFLKGRTADTVMRLGEELEFYSPSIDYNNILYAQSNSVEWNLVNIRNDDVRSTSLDLSDVLPGVKELPGIKEEVFTGEIEELIWNKNGDAVLVKVIVEDESEWILVNLKDVKQSLNITKTFGLKIDYVEMIDDAANQLFVLENQQLRKINTNDRTISQVLLGGIQSFSSYNNKVMYVALGDAKDGTKEQKVGVYRDGDRGGTIIATADMQEKVLVAISKYYDDEYMTYIINDMLTIHYGPVPAYREDVKETDFTGFKTLMTDVKLKNVPDQLTLSPEADYLVASQGKNLMVVDLEVGDVYEYESKSERLDWFDTSMIASVVDGSLEVWDFDYTNLRTLVKQKDAAESADSGNEDLLDNKMRGDLKSNDLQKEASVTTEINATVVNYPALIASNNRFMYYVVKAHNGLVLMRERIRD